MSGKLIDTSDSDFVPQTYKDVSSLVSPKDDSSFVNPKDDSSFVNPKDDSNFVNPKDDSSLVIYRPKPPLLLKWCGHASTFPM
jgi:hypothetical protein